MKPPFKTTHQMKRSEKPKEKTKTKTKKYINNNSRAK